MRLPVRLYPLKKLSKGLDRLWKKRYDKKGMEESVFDPVSSGTDAVYRLQQES